MLSRYQPEKVFAIICFILSLLTTTELIILKTNPYIIALIWQLVLAFAVATNRKIKILKESIKG